MGTKCALGTKQAMKGSCKYCLRTAETRACEASTSVARIEASGSRPRMRGFPRRGSIMDGNVTVMTFVTHALFFNALDGSSLPSWAGASPTRYRFFTIARFSILTASGATEDDRAALMQQKKWAEWASTGMESCAIKTLLAGGGGSFFIFHSYSFQ